MIRLPIRESLRAKLQYIAKYNDRSINKEVAAVLTWYINKFEQKHGKIKVEIVEEIESRQHIDNGGMSMYQSDYICPDCGNRLMVSWRWPEIIMNRPVHLVFICKQCNGEIKEIPESSTVIYSSGRNILDRHLDVYNQATPFMTKDYTCIHSGYVKQYNDPAIMAYKQGITAGYSSTCGVAEAIV